MDYKIYKNTISQKSSNQVFRLFVESCCFYCPNIFKKSEKYKNGWINQKFISKMKLFRKKYKKRFSAMYDSIQVSNELSKFAFDNNLADVAKSFLKVEKDNLLVRGLGLRIDFPKDNRNSYGWHQDNAYDKFNLYSKNGVILWVPLIDTNEENGTLIIKPGSQNSSFNCSRLIKNGSKYKSKQIIVMKKYLKKYTSKSISVKKNSSLATYSGIFHKSGKNSSDQIRFTIVTRYNNLFSKDFLYYRNLKK
jgi:ectoine hydroxylase-related dioxygenase (phytanoyl-CoA dioxygenase family)